MNAPTFQPDARIAVLGAGVEGRAVLDYLERLGCRSITVCDKDPSVEVPAGVEARLGDDYLRDLTDFQVVFRSPGIPRDLAGLEDAARAGVIITSATIEFFHRCPCTIVGVTGSNGKTTTTELIARTLGELYRQGVHVGGNDRRPLLAELPVIERDHVVVLELSSFQLQDLPQSPHVAVVLNVTPNHLDVHPSFEAYVAAKSAIVRHQGPSDYAVLNWAFTRVREMAAETRARAIFFNQAKGDEGAFVRDGKIVVRREGVDQSLMSLAELPLHASLDNVLAASVVAQLFGAEIDLIRRVIAEFPGVPHRIQLVRELDGVRYYDDSASTTPESTMNALRSFPEGKVVLIAGGTDKGLQYEALAKEIVRTRTRAFLIGSTRETIARSIREVAERMKAEGHASIAATLLEAVAGARRAATPGDAVVLSPACASFDMFKNAKDRGDRFQELVRSLH